jgi:hypothetical protein
MDDRLKAVAADFAKDTDKENKGTWATYKSRQYLIARAHRNNTGFAKTVEAQMRPYRRLIDAGNMEAMKDKAAEVMQAIYAASVLLAIKDVDGSDIPYTAADGVELYKLAPDFSDFVFKFANQEDNFALETEAKN